MLRAIILFGILLTMSLGTGLAHARPLPSGEDSPPAPRPRASHAGHREAAEPADLVDPSGVLQSTTSSRHGKSGASGPEYYLYGAPGSTEGGFETELGVPDWQGWTSVDLTEVPPRWQVSTFEADNLNNHGPGNHAFWAGRSSSRPGLARPATGTTGIRPWCGHRDRPVNVPMGYHLGGLIGRHPHLGEDPPCRVCGSWYLHARG